MRPLLIIAFVLLIASCNKREPFATHVHDYDRYLSLEDPKTTSKYFELWNSKITVDSTQLLSFGHVASEYQRYFQNTGDIQYLKKAEASLNRAVEIAAVNKAAYLRALARNYIAQHRFREALEKAVAARRLGSGLYQSQALLFDIHMELGNYVTARGYLDSIHDMSNFGYLIRVAKYNDHKGQLDTAIRFMEKAKKKAESANNKQLKVWTYANLADYYGHAGRLEDAYSHYLHTLALDPYNAHAKRGIAWIVFSHERNGREAMRILDMVEDTHTSPEHFLFKAKIAEYMGDATERTVHLGSYLRMVGNPSYGSMYKLPTAELYLEESSNLEKALQLAKEEVGSRPTPETFSMLALAHLKKGNKEKALEIIRQEVLGATSEPEVLLRVSEIFRAHAMEDQVAALKKELEGAIFELGPASHARIAAL